MEDVAGVVQGRQRRPGDDAFGRPVVFNLASTNAIYLMASHRAEAHPHHHRVNQCNILKGQPPQANKTSEVVPVPQPATASI